MKTTGPIDDIAIEESSGNPYADIGVSNADEMLVKAGLAYEIAQIIENHNLSLQHAAELLGASPPKLSDLLRGKFRTISQAEMTEYLNRLAAM